MDVKIDESWKRELQAEFDSEYFLALAEFVRGAYRSGVCYPPGAFIFEAFNRTPFDKVKAVVIGQDPYPIGLSGADADIDRAATDALMTREAMYDTVPMWHVPQAFNWAWQKGHKSEQPRYPTEEELVSMTWQPIAAGVNGLIYYAFHRICMATEGAERDEYLRRAAAAAAEVKARMAIILSEPGPKVESAPKGMVCRTWRTADGKVTLLAANTTRRALVGTVAFAGGLASQTVELSPLGHKFIEITSTKK